jgi:hypothetical protein
MSSLDANPLSHRLIKVSRKGAGFPVPFQGIGMRASVQAVARRDETRTCSPMQFRIPAGQKEGSDKV